VTGVADGAKLYRPAQKAVDQVTLESPALEVMTDLREVQALTTEPEASIEAAHTRMKRLGVRLLFVTDHEDRLLGLITATDILSEKVVQAMQARGVSKAEVLVAEIMTPHEHLDAIHMTDLRGAKVGHVLATLKHAGRQHAIVVEVHQPPVQERIAALLQRPAVQTVCGLFSTTQIARQLGLQLASPNIATTFAEVEALLAR
jgi:CBS-domain-containing membrane protein